MKEIQIYQAHTYFLPIKGITSTTNNQFNISEMFENIITFITTHQNVHEWFVLRMFCLTASASSITIKFILKDSNYNLLPHWEDVVNFISRHETIVVPSIELDHQNEMDWAASVVNDEDNWEWMRDEDNWEWMRDEDNVTSLEASQREALREYINGVTEKHLSQRFDIHLFLGYRKKNEIFLVIQRTN